MMLTERIGSTERLAIVLMCGTQFANIVMYSGAKWVGAVGVPVMEILAGRYLVTMIVSLAVVLAWHGISIPRLSRIGTHLLRNGFLLGSNGFSFAALHHLKLGDVQAILYLSPFVTTGAALVFLNETLRPRVIPGLICAFAGVALVVRPEGDASWALAYAVGMTLCSGLYAVTTRALGSSEPPLVTLLFSGVLTTIVVTVAAVAFTSPVIPSARVTGVIAVVGLAGTLSQLGLITSHQLARASLLAPFVYIQMPIALAVGMVTFGESPDVFSLIGAIIVVSAGVWISRYRPSALAADARRPAFSAGCHPLSVAVGGTARSTMAARQWPARARRLLGRPYVESIRISGIIHASAGGSIRQRAE